MLLNILHVYVVILCVVVSATSVSIAGSWELHLHHVWWIGNIKVLFLPILWRNIASPTAMSDKISVWQTVVMHVRVGKLLLIQLVHFRSNGSIRSTSSNTFSSKDVATLGCSSWLSGSIETSLVHFLHHLNLIRSKNVLPASSKAITISVLARRDNFTLRRRYFIIILLYRT